MAAIEPRRYAPRRQHRSVTARRFLNLRMRDFVYAAVPASNTVRPRAAVTVSVLVATLAVVGCAESEGGDESEDADVVPSMLDCETSMHVVEFADPAVEDNVRFLTGIYDDELLHRDLCAVEAIVVTNRTVTDLSGVQWCTSLKVLRIGDGEVDDVTVLTELTMLETIELASNRVEDASPLAGLTSLKTLDVSSNQLTDLGFATNLTQLRDLRVGSNRITDISSLAEHHELRTLVLASNAIEDLDPLSTTGAVEFLDVRYNDIVDLSPVLDAFAPPRSEDGWKLRIEGKPLSEESCELIGELFRMWIFTDMHC